MESVHSSYTAGCPLGIGKGLEMEMFSAQDAEKLIEASKVLQATLSVWMVEVARARKNSAGAKILRFPGPVEERAKAAQDTLESFLIAGEEKQN